MNETPKEVLDEYGISEVITRYIMSSEAEEVLDEYVYTLLNRISFLQEQNKQLKDFIEGSEFDLTPEFRKCFPNGFK